MNSREISPPDHTAVRVALWRAMHLEVDSAPFVFEDGIGLKLISPTEDWRQRPDMHPVGTRGYRASIVGRARYIEDLLIEKIAQGTKQYVILGAGLDSFAQRRRDLLSKVQVFEIDEPKTQEWKKSRLMETGFGIAGNLNFVPVDFEAGESWPSALVNSGFNKNEPSFISSTGVAMYLTKEANLETFKKLASFAHGSTFVMTFMLPLGLVEPQDQAGYQMVMEKAAAAGTPFLSLFTPSEILELAKKAGFKTVKHVPRQEIIDLYFFNRSDELSPSSGEEFIIATT